ncbi:hypothetical protein BH23PLA1_BH23PLA1_11860 [soil metagenome]
MKPDPMLGYRRMGLVRVGYVDGCLRGSGLRTDPSLPRIMRATEVKSQPDMTVDPDVIEVVVKALQRAEEPATASKLRGGLSGPAKTLSEPRLRNLLEVLVVNGRAHRFEPSKKNGHPRYWSHDFDHYARRVVVGLLEKKGNLSRSELDKALKSPLKEPSRTQVDQFLQDLITRREVYEWPPYGKARASKFGATPPDPRQYFKEPIEKIVRQLSGVGVTREQMFQAVAEILGISPPPPSPPEPDLEERVLEQMNVIQPAAANGALVSIRDLRRSLASQISDKETFERAIWRLVERGKAAVQRHDHPENLTDQERAELVTDGQGNYFIGIALRRGG